MLEHHLDNPSSPTRAIVLGARGFIGRHLLAHLKTRAIPALGVASDELDLTASDAADRLVKLIGANDSLVVLNAITPDKGRDIDTLMLNLAMARAVCTALAKQPVAHVIYVSSDAVYPFDSGIVNEHSPSMPTDLYSSMHRTREVMFEASTKGPLAVLRPTLIYGVDDTHNSYGPNRFRRQAAKDGKIILGGRGEETRDHISVNDVVELITLTLLHRSSGKLNLATGGSISFHELAQLVAAQFDLPIEIVFTPRSAPITHRSFDITAVRKAFPTFAFTPLRDGLMAAHRAMLTAAAP